MKRAQATAAVDQMFHRFFDARLDRPLCLVTEIMVFGSYARGATEPHDVDIAIQFDHDDKYAEDMLNAMATGRHPHTPFRRALAGGRRSLHIICDRLPAAVTADGVVLWRTGDTLDAALKRLHAIPVDETAGRATRDAMIDAFTGLDRQLPMTFRRHIADAVTAGALTVEQLTLPDQQVKDRLAREHIDDRWKPTNTLHRAAHAALAHYERQGIDPARVHLHGRDIAGPDTDTAYYASMQLRYTGAIRRCLGELPGEQWLEIVHPTRTKPLIALLVKPADREVLAKLLWG